MTTNKRKTRKGGSRASPETRIRWKDQVRQIKSRRTYRATPHPRAASMLSERLRMQTRPSKYDDCVKEAEREVHRYQTKRARYEYDRRREYVDRFAACRGEGNCDEVRKRLDAEIMDYDVQRKTKKERQERLRDEKVAECQKVPSVPMHAPY